MMYTKINIHVNGGILVGEILIKSVGKKVIVNNDEIIINKTIGKNLEIPLRNINNISYTEGMSNKAGILYIDYLNAVSYTHLTLPTT